eukprot:gene16892-biopygen14361
MSRCPKLHVPGGRWTESVPTGSDSDPTVALTVVREKWVGVGVGLTRWYRSKESESRSRKVGKSEKSESGKPESEKSESESWSGSWSQSEGSSAATPSSPVAVAFFTSGQGEVCKSGAHQHANCGFHACVSPPQTKVMFDAAIWV